MQGTGQMIPPGQEPGAPPGQQPGVPPAKAKPAAPPIPLEFQADKIMTQAEPELIALLKDSSATEFQRAMACKRLAQVGTKVAVPALAALLADQRLSHYARFGLEPLPDPSADETLREALKKLKGRLLVGVITSIGQRQDAKAVEALAKLLYDADSEVARAAAAALGRISGPLAAKTLQAGLGKTKGALRTAVAEAGLVCAEGLMAQGDRKGAFAFYDVLSRADIPKTVRLAAMHSTIAAETSLRRPR